jgi:hypothetical protein
MQMRRSQEKISMNKRRYAGIVPALLILLFAGACSARFVETAAAGLVVPTVDGGPTHTDIATVEPQVPAATVQNVSAQVPICQATTSCAALNAEQIPLGCVKKIPYTNVLVPPGTTFQVLDNAGEFACIDSGVVVNDKQVLTCHGKELYSFQVKLSNAACGATLQTETGQCQDGYGYDAANQCCAPARATADGTATVTVNLGACPLPGP